MRPSQAFGVLLVLTILCGCDDTKSAPKGIDADGTTYLACSGFVTVSGNMQQGYEVQFTDQDGLGHDVRGIHKLEISDLPPDLKVCGTGQGANNTGNDNVSDACKQARADGTAMKWNDQTRKFDINPVCEK